MRHEEIASLRAGSPAWRLLRADNAPLILSFLGRVFVDENVRDIAASQLVSLLDDELFALNERLGQATYPKSAQSYLDAWSAPNVGWMRKYYPPGSDEPHYDATPAVEKAVAWVRALRERSFVGTESRLNTIYSEDDPQPTPNPTAPADHPIDPAHQNHHRQPPLTGRPPRGLFRTLLGAGGYGLRVACRGLRDHAQVRA